MQRSYRTTTVTDIDYPNNLLLFPERPDVLHYYGSPVWQNKLCISVVGSRTPSEYAEKWLDFELSALLQQIPCVIISGGARGVDQLAHKIALRNNTPTVVFLPSGLDRPYPHYLGKWYDMVVSAGGAIVSHLPHDAPLNKWHFLTRNKWIAGISNYTIAVEARRKSGTYMTARYVMDNDRKLGIMPTYPTEIGMGGLDLIFQGAHILRDHVDMLLLCHLSQLPQAKN